MKNRMFLINLIVVAGTALLLRAIGIYLNAFLSRKIGAEGVGLFSLIQSIYIMASAIVTSGISLAVSRVVAEQMEKNQHDKIRPTMLKCILLSVVLSAAISAVLFFGADFIAATFLGDTRTVPSLVVMAPSFPFMAISACMRGYFIAARKAHKSAGSSLFEQLFRIALTVFILQNFVSNDLESACKAVVFGSTSAEIIGCFFTFLIYLLERRKQQAVIRQNSGCPAGASTKLILAISIPMTLSAGLRTGLRTAESMLIPAGLRKSGVSHEASLAEFGVVSMTMPVLFFPAFILMSVAMLIMPEIARAAASRQKRRVQYMGARIIQMTLYMAILVAGVLVIFSDELCLALYQNLEAGRMLRLLSPLIPLIYLDFMVDGMLNGLNQQMMTLKLNTVDSALRIGMILLLVPLMGVNGYIITVYVSTLFNASLSLKRLLKVSGIGIPVFSWVIKPVMLALLSALTSSILFRFLSPAYVQSGAFAIAQVTLACFIYLVLMRITGSITKQDMVWFKSFFTNNKAEQIQIT